MNLQKREENFDKKVSYSYLVGFVSMQKRYKDWMSRRDWMSEILLFI